MALNSSNSSTSKQLALKGLNGEIVSLLSSRSVSSQRWLENVERTLFITRHVITRYQIIQTLGTDPDINLGEAHGELALWAYDGVWGGALRGVQGYSIRSRCQEFAPWSSKLFSRQTSRWSKFTFCVLQWYKVSLSVCTISAYMEGYALWRLSRSASAKTCKFSGFSTCIRWRNY